MAHLLQDGVRLNLMSLEALAAAEGQAPAASPRHSRQEPSILTHARFGSGRLTNIPSWLTVGNGPHICQSSASPCAGHVLDLILEDMPSTRGRLLAEDWQMWGPFPTVSQRGDIRQSPTSRAGVPREAAASRS